MNKKIIFIVLICLFFVGCATSNFSNLNLNLNNKSLNNKPKIVKKIDPKNAWMKAEQTAEGDIIFWGIQRSAVSISYNPFSPFHKLFYNGEIAPGMHENDCPYWHLFGAIIKGEKPTIILFFRQANFAEILNFQNGFDPNWLKNFEVSSFEKMMFGEKRLSDDWELKIARLSKMPLLENVANVKDKNIFWADVIHDIREPKDKKIFADEIKDVIAKMSIANVIFDSYDYTKLGYTNIIGCEKDNIYRVINFFKKNKDIDINENDIKNNKIKWQVFYINSPATKWHTYNVTLRELYKKMFDSIEERLYLYYKIRKDTGIRRKFERFNVVGIHYAMPANIAKMYNFNSYKKLKNYMVYVNKYKHINDSNLSLEQRKEIRSRYYPSVITTAETKTVVINEHYVLLNVLFYTICKGHTIDSYTLQKKVWVVSTWR